MVTEPRRGYWLIAGTPGAEPYPCRCHERRYDRCSAAWCPCAGRTDPPFPDCCGSWYGPADAKAATEAWRRSKGQ